MSIVEKCFLTFFSRFLILSSGVSSLLLSRPGDPPRALAAWFNGSNIPELLAPDAVPGNPAPRIPVIGRLTPSAIPVTGLLAVGPLGAVPILPVVIPGAAVPGTCLPLEVPGTPGLPLEVPGGRLP